MLDPFGTTSRKPPERNETVKLRFLGKDSTPTNSPTLYATDEDSYIVQGWIVTDAAILAGLDVADAETVVEVPAALLSHLARDGVVGEVTNAAWPIVHVKENGNYIVQGPRVTDVEALSQMTIPDHETCVAVTKPAMLALVAGA
jgi:hypothetical protein